MTSAKTSNSVVASAPANTMLMGEHAVLFGHKALVCALTQRLYVQAHKHPNEQIVIESKLGHFSCALADLNAHLNAQLSHPSPFSFVLQALAMCHLTQGVRLVIESDFEHTIGLGSSAAVTVAALGAIKLLTKGCIDTQEVMSLGIEVIRKVQASGSGADVAASAMGGIVKFKAKPVSAVKVLLADQTWRSAPKLRLVYCGYKTATPKVIALVAAAAAKHPHHFQQCYSQMGACVEASEAALSHGHWHDFAQCMNDYQNLMRDLGVSDDTIETIIALGHEQARNQTNTQNPALLGEKVLGEKVLGKKVLAEKVLGEKVFAAKISGSGLGDCVLLLGSETIDWGHAQISVQIDPQGLRQEAGLPSLTQSQPQPQPQPHLRKYDEH